jgi:hypothetical protein
LESILEHDFLAEDALQACMQAYALAGQKHRALSPGQRTRAGTVERNLGAGRADSHQRGGRLAEALSGRRVCARSEALRPTATPDAISR